MPFDLDTLKSTGPTTVVLSQGTVTNNASGTLTVEISRDGTLTYGAPAYGNSQIVLVSRDGSSRPLDVQAGRYFSARVSPDGSRLAVDDNQLALAIVDLARGTKVTPHEPAPGSGFPTWNSDGTRVILRRNSRPYSISANGNQDVGPVKYSNSNDYPSGAGQGPDDLIMVRTATDLGAEIYQFSLSGAYVPKALVSARGYQGGAQLSPDGRWLVYQSGKPQVLFDQPFEYGQGISIANYDVLPDGRFVMLRAEAGGAPFHVIRNWADSLKAR